MQEYSPGNKAMCSAQISTIRKTGQTGPCSTWFFSFGFCLPPRYYARHPSKNRVLISNIVYGTENKDWLGHGVNDGMWEGKKPSGIVLGRQF